MYDEVAEALAFLEGFTMGSAEAACQLEIVKSYIRELETELVKWEDATYVNLYDH